jgi:hypothetical protein
MKNKESHLQRYKLFLQIKWMKHHFLLLVSHYSSESSSSCSCFLRSKEPIKIYLIFSSFPQEIILRFFTGSSFTVSTSSILSNNSIVRHLPKTTFLPFRNVVSMVEIKLKRELEGCYYNCDELVSGFSKFDILTEPIK